MWSAAMVTLAAARTFPGNFLFSTGPNTEVGGPRNTPCHMDIPMRNCSVYLDDKAVVLDGDVVAPEESRSTARSRSDISRKTVNE
jgi:hypothetical protein